MTDLVLREDEGHVARLVLNSPANFNALSEEMIAALTAALDAVSEDEGIRAVILSGAGKVFSAGHDLRQMQAARDDADGGREAHARLFENCAAMMQRIAGIPQPVIAQVHGIATAAGCRTQHHRGNDQRRQCRHQRLVDRGQAREIILDIAGQQQIAADNGATQCRRRVIPREQQIDHQRP